MPEEKAFTKEHLKKWLILEQTWVSIESPSLSFETETIEVQREQTTCSTAHKYRVLELEPSLLTLVAQQDSSWKQRQTQTFLWADGHELFPSRIAQVLRCMPGGAASAGGEVGEEGGRMYSMEKTRLKHYCSGKYGPGRRDQDLDIFEPPISCAWNQCDFLDVSVMQARRFPFFIESQLVQGFLSLATKSLEYVKLTMQEGQ